MLFVLVAPVLAGCSDQVSPILDTGRAYTVYGLIDAHADTQAVRVFAIEGTLDLAAPVPLGAAVNSLELESGARHTWEESIIRFSNGRYGHVYWSGFRGKYGHSYRLELKRPDQVTTSVQVAVPPWSEPLRLDPVLGVGYAVLPVLWRDAPRLHDIGVAYTTNFGTYEFEYSLDQEERQDGVVVEIRLSEDARHIFRELNRARHPIADLRLREVRLSVLVSNREWTPPGGRYDPDVLIEPGVLSNVSNGFGFVGAGYDTSMAFDPPDSVKIAAGIPVGGG